MQQLSGSHPLPCRRLSNGPATPGPKPARNCGENWNAVITGLISTNVFVLAIDPATPATLYAGTNGSGVFKSTNGGENWSAIDTGHINIDVITMAMYPATP